MATTTTSTTAEQRARREIGTGQRKDGMEIAMAAMATVTMVDHLSITARTTMTPRTIIHRIRTTTLLLPITGRTLASRLGSKALEASPAARHDVRVEKG